MTHRLDMLFIVMAFQFIEGLDYLQMQNDANFQNDIFLRNILHKIIDIMLQSMYDIIDERRFFDKIIVKTISHFQYFDTQFVSSDLIS